MKCGYIRDTWDCGETLEVEEKHTGRYGARGQKREPKKEPTPEDIIRQNQWKRVRELRRLVKWNFTTGDSWITLTYQKDKRVSWEAGLVQEWAIVRGNIPYASGNTVKFYLQKGAVREEQMEYPNPGWGYGRLDLYRTFEIIN